MEVEEEEIMVEERVGCGSEEEAAETDGGGGVFVKELA